MSRMLTDLLDNTGSVTIGEVPQRLLDDAKRKKDRPEWIRFALI